jgi:8-amino-7-oxononanoate synthase
VANRCELVQGYALSKPLPAAELAGLLDTRALRTAAPGMATPRAPATVPDTMPTPAANGQASDAEASALPPALRDLSALKRSHPMMDAVIDQIDGRMIRVGEQWLADFASCNYLGFDLDAEIIDAVPAYLSKWGTHPSWSRLLGSPVLYEQIEERLSDLLGSPDSLVLPTITHIHMSAIPALAGQGTIFLDARSHKTIYDGCQMAKTQGATVKRFAFEDPAHLAQLLRGAPAGRRLVCMDGVNSMTGNAPDLPAFARVAREHDALLYVDDAHGFGVIGERGAGESCDYGMRGNSIVRYCGESYENLVLVGGFSKAYSSLLSFVACSSEIKEALKILAPPYLYSGPSPVASLATVLAGFEVNERRGDELRAVVHRHSARVLECLQRLGAYTPNRSGLPIVEIPLREHERLAHVGRTLFDRGVYVTLAAYPLVPREEVGFRVQLTAANTDAELDVLTGALEHLAAEGELRSAESEAASAPTLSRMPAR